MHVCVSLLIVIKLVFSPRSIRDMAGLRQKRDQRRFLYYTLYSLSIPLALTTYTGVVDYWNLYGSESQFDPDIGHKKCFFSCKLLQLTTFNNKANINVNIFS